MRNTLREERKRCSISVLRRSKKSVQYVRSLHGSEIGHSHTAQKLLVVLQFQNCLSAVGRGESAHDCVSYATGPSICRRPDVYSNLTKRDLFL